MFDCGADVLAYHDDEVTLPSNEQGDMRERRNKNRRRLEKGLDKNEKPRPREFRSQGSYAMRTMVQYPDKNYDIDDGVYFDKSKLVGPRGAELSALEARQMVCDAVDDGSFKTPPKLHNNCVRVIYDAGYNIDLPVYRRNVVDEGEATEKETYQLASTDWTDSDARDVTNWYVTENDKQSPDTTNGKQLRRITREIKKFARSRPSWENQILGGFGITALVVECYRPNQHREDQSLHDTMQAIHDRLVSNLSISHPVTSGDTITNDPDDPKARVFKDKLAVALDWLDPLFDEDCDREKALKCWDKVFSTSFFSNRLENDDSDDSVASSKSIRESLATAASPRAVNKRGGGRYA